MIIGVPSEIKTDEWRVALTPAGVRELTSAGHTVLVEKGAGDGSSMPDADFVRTGAKIVDDADEVWAVGRPRLQGEGARRRRSSTGSGPGATRRSSPTCTWRRHASAPRR